MNRKGAEIAEKCRLTIASANLVGGGM